jgi:hypothetical protein
MIGAAKYLALLHKLHASLVSNTLQFEDGLFCKSGPSNLALSAAWS